MKLDKYEKAAVNWLFKAQDATPDGGISKFYHTQKGWCSESYKEVSGYIISTLLDLHKLTKENKYKERALKIADWELKVQEKDGKWDYVFDTGQVIIGLCQAYRETKDEKYKESAIKAADWLIKIQDKNGNWTKEIFASGIKKRVYKFFKLLSHTYNTRTAWALLEVWKITKNNSYKQAATKNLDLALSKQLENGYYSGSTNITHFLIYTARGFLESGIILKNKKYINSAKKFADGCSQLVKETGFFPGEVNKNFKTKTKISYLSANAQLSILFSKLFLITKNKKYKNDSLKLLNYLKSKQNLSSKNSSIKGGITGSYPINGKYEPNKILSWATKFYIDALLINKKGLKSFKSRGRENLNFQLAWITNLLNKKKIKYFVDGGTLLGLMRDGKLLTQDEDIDISIWNYDKEKLKLLLPEIKKRKYKIQEGHYKNLFYSYTLFPPQSIKDREIDIKIFRKYKDYAWCPERYAKNSDKTGLIYYISKAIRLPFLLLVKIIPILNPLINKIFFKVDTWKIPLKYIEKTKFLKDTKISTPLNWEQYLKFRFGDWKIPNKNWNYIEDDKTLKHKEPISLGIPIKNYY